jgi:hypothetical protein
MGIDYSFRMTFAKEDLAKVQDAVRDFKFLFPPDYFIDMYLKQVDEDLELKPGEMRDLSAWFSMYVRESGDKIIVSFMAGTNDTSVLLAASKSIEDTVIKFWRTNNGIDFEFDGELCCPVEISRSDGTVFRTGDRYGEDHRPKRGRRRK